ncbi:3-phosphoshikimate 1-carboxyvinyltransferase [Clostridium sp. AN503]|uniref:3-phosphoshikimate 1-carboxyvinyltransferase n=1 Tax=Clostridium sp. AN503 TaxID=3160598 RepID=UPI003458D131
MKFSKCSALRGEITIPGDKSVSHRSVMFGSIAKGTTEIHHFLQGADCLSTISCFRSMGVEIENNGSAVLIHGNGLHGLKKPHSTLDCGNSGTTTRLISGILAAQDFTVTLTGDASIQKRPMKRIIDPLAQMGAQIRSLRGNGCAPLEITGSPLHGIHYQSPVASAQVKSAILLAGLYADGDTRVTEPYISRNHTELMLSRFGADVRTEGTTAIIRPASELYGQQIMIPGDISSAAFFIAAGLLIPGSEILIQGVGINPTRDGILHVCRDMGANITLLNPRSDGEPTADLLVRSSALHGTVISGPIIPTLIDELPMIAAMACFAEGDTIIRDAAELKVKESNRIEVMVRNLNAMGADVEETEDGMIIHGGKPLHGAVIDSKLDHRIAMTFAVTACLADGETEILGAECVNISYPEFYTDLERLKH